MSSASLHLLLTCTCKCEILVTSDINSDVFLCVICTDMKL